MRKYDEDYKREAVKKIHDGQSVASVARELGVAESLLHTWKRQTVEASSDDDRELLALRKKLREVETLARHIKKVYGSAVRVKRDMNDVARGRTDAVSVSGFCCVGV